VRTPGCGWSVTCPNEPWPSGSRRRRHREPLPLRRCPEGRRVPSGSRLPGGWCLGLGVLWLGRRARAGPRVVQQAEAELAATIRSIHAESGDTSGSPRVTAELRRRGWMVNHKRVERLMAAHGTVGHRPRRRRGLTKPDTAIHPRRTWWGGCSTPTNPMSPGAAMPPGSPPTRAGRTWRQCSTWPRGACSAGRWTNTTTPAWSVAPWRRPSPPAVGPGWTPRPSIATAAANTPRPPASTSASGWASPLHGPHRVVPGQRRGRVVLRHLKVELVDRCHYRTHAQARTSTFRWIAW
jgi:hypothetical protein